MASKKGTKVNLSASRFCLERWQARLSECYSFLVSSCLLNLWQLSLQSFTLLPRSVRRLSQIIAVRTITTRPGTAGAFCERNVCRPFPGDSK